MPTTVEGYIIVGGVEEPDHVDLDPSRAVSLSLERLEFDLGTALLADEFSDVQFVGLSTMRAKADIRCRDISGMAHRLTNRW
jgi:hypothetical protein